MTIHTYIHTYILLTCGETPTTLYEFFSILPATRSSDLILFNSIAVTSQDKCEIWDHHGSENSIVAFWVVTVSFRWSPKFRRNVWWDTGPSDTSGIASKTTGCHNSEGHNKQRRSVWAVSLLSPPFMFQQCPLQLFVYNSPHISGKMGRSLLYYTM
jgi:hypothetical protein